MRPDNSSLRQILRREAFRLYQQSIVERWLGWVRISGRAPFSDGVKALQHRPLGMFFYNQRAIFFGFGAIFIAVLSISLWFYPYRTLEMEKTVLILTVFWFTSVLLTLGLHRSFIERLQRWASSPMINEFPPLFDRYFWMDFCAVIFVIGVGRVWGLNLAEFAFLLFANLVAYTAHAGGWRRSNLVTQLVLLSAVAYLLYQATRVPIGEPGWFYTILYLGPLLGMTAVTVLSVFMISWLRSSEHRITLRRLQVLRAYEEMLSEVATKQSDAKDDHNQSRYSERRFQKRVLRVLNNLCSLGPPFWYGSACFWLYEIHQDRGELLVPGPYVDFDEAEAYEEGMSISAGFLKQDRLVLLHSLKYQSEGALDGLSRFRRGFDGPAALIPLCRENRAAGAITLYGVDHGPMLQRQEEEFLRSLGTAILNTKEQWEARHRASLQREMDALFECEHLVEVFQKTAKIMLKYLSAAGCLVIFRPDQVQPEMAIMAKEGFDKGAYDRCYRVGEGQTGKCAQTGKTIRWDDVPAHCEMFDPGLLKSLEKAHGRPIISWMAIPIGGQGGNRGVIKLVNRLSLCRWFTEEDQQLGELIAKRLQVIIEKFLHIESIEAATAEAERQKEKATGESERATAALKKAEEAARQRQQDLMTITHQLQGPLISVIGALSGIKRDSLLRPVQDRIGHAQALVEDALALCYGTTTTFAREVGREASFGKHNIDAPAEMRRLSTRLQATNARDDITFGHKSEKEFPTLRMDRNVFTSVLYSLIHNAMKYADDYSEVILECSIERATGEAALKVKSVGEPIHPNEVGLIFEKFGRGRAIERTGRHHSGVGLGLWVARELMRAVGGDLTVELSPAHPRLSVFVVHIPQTSE